MKCTKVNQTIQSSLSLIYAKVPLVSRIVQSLHENGGRIFLVGGAVRDIILLKDVKDLDIEVHDLSLEKLEDVLRLYGYVRLVGKAYGVMKIDGLDADFSLPRSDGKGRFPEVVLDPKMSLKEACKRRDLTMNAMAIDMISSEFYDPFGGVLDIQEKRLSTPDPKLFVEDPLRLYRVMQFVGRFEMEPNQELNQLCQTMDISSVSHERIVAEFEKLFLQSKKPSIAFKWLAKISRLQTILPELYTTQGIAQNPSYHPEGDVFEHTMQAVDGAALLDYQSDEKRLIIVFAALCHDLGKAITTRMVEGVLRSYGHDVAGVALADQLLDRILAKPILKKPITRLVRYHMDPVSLVKNNAKAGAYKRLAKNLVPATITDLVQLAICDKSARNPVKGTPLAECPEPLIQTFLETAQKYGVAEGPELPLLTGDDLISDVPEGPKLGLLLERAYQIQIDEGIIDKKELKKRVMKDHIL